MDENEHKSVGEVGRDKSGPEVSRTRRRLVKSAVAAAPVVLTLRSGAALANASAYQCIEKNQNEPTPDVLLGPEEEADMWVRESVQCRQLQQQGSDDSFWVYEDRNSSGQWIEETDDLIEPRIFEDQGGSGKMRNAKDESDNNYDVISERTCEILVLFDAEGNRVGIGQPEADAMPITGSCWASIDPAWADM
ncbi:hypothetical protein [Methylohalobius crimeensis]|uniref:hypothetical protein n=1 Tax=Methylohalobius crimeensis TaxID=244365 RepID=UPI0003B39D48|nr:hypothetical protein [Methylohalobius crimeensis]